MTSSLRVALQYAVSKVGASAIGVILLSLIVTAAGLAVLDIIL